MPNTITLPYDINNGDALDADKVMANEDAIVSEYNSEIGAKSGSVVTTTESQTLTNKTLTSPVLNTGVSGSAIDTDSTMAANSDTKLASQKAVKTAIAALTAVKASGAEITTGTDDAKFATSKALADAGVNKPLQSKIITLTRDLTAATADVAYTGVGFIPSSLQAIAVIDGTAFVSQGFADSTKASQCTYQYGSNTFSYSAGLVAMSPTIGAYQLATVKTYDADGFTLTWTKTSTPTGTGTIRIICYK